MRFFSQNDLELIALQNKLQREAYAFIVINYENQYGILIFYFIIKAVPCMLVA